MISQIYEVQTPQEAEALIELGVDHIGSVVLSAKAWKNDSLAEALRLVARCGAKSTLIPLFNTPADVLRVLEFYRPDIVHFCEDLIHTADGPALLKKLVALQTEIKARFPEMAIMRSIPIPPAGAPSPVSPLALAQEFAAVSDYFLTDTVLVAPTGQPQAPQPVDGFVGITGRTCDWDLARELVSASAIPVILAGGLDAENVYAAIMETRPAGVDSCTGTNARDATGQAVRFKKDLDKVRRFVQQTQKAAEALAWQPDIRDSEKIK